MERQLLRKMLIYNFFLAHKGKILESFWEKELKTLYLTIEKAHEQYKADLDIDWVRKLLDVYNPAMSTAARRNLAILLDDIRNEPEPPDQLAADVIQDLFEKERARQIGSLAADVLNGKKKMSELQALTLPLLENISAETVENFEEIEFNLDGLLEFTSPNNLYAFRHPGLQERIGGAGPGNLGVLFGRPESGKSTLAVDTTAGYLGQGLRTGYFGNEEPARRLYLRLVCSALKKTEREIRDDVEGTKKAFSEQFAKHLRMIECVGMDITEVDRWCQKNKPKVIVLDQLDKFSINGQFNRDDQRLGELYTYAREIAKRHKCLVWAVTQCSAEGEGALNLDFSMMAGSKCLLKDTKILMFDGTVKSVQDVRIGDKVMSPTSEPRTVVSTATGNEQMYKITHKKGGDSYVVNKSHILSLVRNNKAYKYVEELPGAAVNVPVCEYVNKSGKWKKCFSGYKTGTIAFPHRDTAYDPYYMGLWLGDGKSESHHIYNMDVEVIDWLRDYCVELGLTFFCKKQKHNGCFKIGTTYKQGIRHPFIEYLKTNNLYKNKHILPEYKVNSEENRLKLLAGLLDTDGCLNKKHNYEYYTIVTKFDKLSEDIRFLCGSLGLYTSHRLVGGLYHLVYISGDIGKIPCKIRRKQSTFTPKKAYLQSSIVVEEYNDTTEYHGFTLKENGLFVLADSFIVTHNTAKAAEADLIIGIGKNKMVDQDDPYRQFTVSKNKINGYHGFIGAILDQHRATYGV